MASSELLNTSVDQLHSSSTPADSASASVPRRRRQSSGLGSQLRVGDTGAPGLATTIAKMSQTSTTKDVSKFNSHQPKTYLDGFKQFAIKHTCILPLFLLAIILGLYAVDPTDSNPVSRFIFLSYEVPTEPGKPAQYAKGRWDVAFVAFYTIVLSFMREFIMLELLLPLSRYAGVKSSGKQARFMEQAYTAIYFAIMGPAGMYVMSRTPVWYFNTRGMYENFPHTTHDAYFKFYYLFQAAYWAQQAIVLILGMEKPRKDFKEMIAHHIVSLTLIAMSYRFHFTYVGLAVYVTHDISDYFLATAKLLNYINHSFVGPYFALFISVWVYMRHYINLHIIWSIFHEFVDVGPFDYSWTIDYETEQFKGRVSQAVAYTLLPTLQALNIFWLFLIFRIAYRFVFNDNLRDDRSDVEESEAETETENGVAPAAITNGVVLGNNGSPLKKRK